MKKLLFSIITTISCMQGLLAQYNENDVQQYIALFKDLAVQEQVRTRVPASIKLAQGILETGAGTSELCLNASNHFGIKCKSNWSGESYLKDDDKRDECFRKYTTARDSYTDHSDFLKNNKRYEALFALPTEDYVSWARGLKKCGYATNPAYADKLISLIERYNLNEYTLLAMKAADQPAIAANNGEMSFGYGARPASYVTTQELVPAGDQPDIPYYTITTLHGKKGFYAKKGDALLEYAIKNKIRYTKLLSYNDLEDAPLPYDMFVYIEKKNEKGARAYVISREGEPLQLISQNEGITLEALRKLNHLSAGEEPAAGTKIYLQNDAGQKPQLAGNTDNLPDNHQHTAYKSEQEDAYINKSDLNIREEGQHESTPAVDGRAISAATIPKQENNTVTEQVAPVREASTGRNEKDISNTSKEPVSDMDRLKQRMDRSVYGSAPVTERKSTPAPQEKKEITKQGVPVTKNENTLNRPGKSDPREEPVTSMRKPAEEVIEKPVYTNTANDKFYSNQKNASTSPKEALSNHMSLVKQGKVPRYNPKASGIEHTSAPAPAPRKIAKQQPKKGVKGKKQVVAKGKTGSKKKIAAAKAPAKKTNAKKKK